MVIVDLVVLSIISILYKIGTNYMYMYTYMLYFCYIMAHVVCKF